MNAMESKVKIYIPMCESLKVSKYEKCGKDVLEVVVNEEDYEETSFGIVEEL